MKNNVKTLEFNKSQVNYVLKMLDLFDLDEGLISKKDHMDLTKKFLELAEFTKAGENYYIAGEGDVTVDDYDKVKAIREMMKRANDE